jgi:CRISPR-associated protein Csx3
VAHLFGFVAFFDPKLRQFVVCVSHDPGVRPGDLIP